MDNIKMGAIIRQSWYEAAVRNLSDAERLSFYEVCFAYEFNEIVPTRQSCPYSSVLLMFDMVKQDLARDAEKARNISERNRANGSLGGRPAGNRRLPDDTNPEKPSETQENPPLTDGLPIHSNALQYNTTASSCSSELIYNKDFFEEVLWPLINTGGRYNSRHRACMAMWLEMSDLKRANVYKAAEDPDSPRNPNPYYFLQDFPEPEPRYLTGKEMELEWSAGRSVHQIKVGDKFKVVTVADLEQFGLDSYRELPPK